MKKITAIILASAMLAVCAPALSGCGSGEVTYTLSEEGEKHYIVSCSGFSGLSGEYEIPAYYGEEGTDSYAPVTAIAAEAFVSTSFTKITVPETVTEIGTAAFSFCYSLKTVEFADGINLEKFRHGLFGESSALQKIRVPDSVKSIEGLVFKGCKNLSEITFGAGVETIGVRAFENCKALESVTLPSTLTTIKDKAFYNSGLKAVEIPASVRDTVADDGKQVMGLGYAAFSFCAKLESVTIGGGIKVIPSGAFGYCTALKEVRIPLSVEEVQGAYFEDGEFRCGHAFYGDAALSDIYYDGTEEDWKNIKIENQKVYQNNMTMDNSALLGAVKHFKPNA